MKKIILFLFCLTVILVLTNSKEELLIPDQSIRYRIIANSNSKEDQTTKWTINKELIPILHNITTDATSYEDSQNLIKQELPRINNILSKYTNDFKVNFGNNYFPEKIYHKVKYNAGEYESLVISLGESKGDNWWCVLFPPLCLLEANANDTDEVQYDWYIRNIIKKYS